MAPNGSYTYLTNRNTNTVTAVDTTSVVKLSYRSNVSTTSIPGGIVAGSLGSPAGKLMLVGTGAADLVEVAPGYYAPNWKAANDGTSGSVTYPTSSYGVAFQVRGSQFAEIEMRAGTNANVQVWVDDRMVTTLPVQPAWTTNAVNTLKVDLGDLATHTVRVMVSDAAIGRVWVAPNGIVNQTHHAVPRLFVLGDSMTQGGVYNTGAELGSWLPRFAGSVGVTDYWNGGIGGTGFVTSHDGYPDFASRAVTDAAPSNADVVIVGSWYNDKAAGKSAAEIAAGVANVLGTLNAMESKPYVIVLGAADPTGVNGADYLEIEAAVKPVCVSYGAAFVSPITGEVIDGAGNVVAANGPWITDANKNAFVASDDLLTNNEGAHYLATRMEEAYRALPVRVWSSEFDSIGDWNPQTGRWGAGDGEQQYYTTTNHSVVNGQLVIQVRQETAPDGMDAPYDYTSGRIVTAGTAGFEPPVRIVARVKMPVSEGLSPAFWAVGMKPGAEFTWPQQGEIDIAEAAINPNHPGSDTTASFNMHGPSVLNPNVDVSAAPSPGFAQLDLTEWHEYEIQWRTGSMTWLVDGQEIGTVTQAQYEAAGGSWEPFSGEWPIYLTLNVAVGNEWAGNEIGSLPAQMEVDWVRAYSL